MNGILKNLLPTTTPLTADGMINAVREIMQSLALLGLWRARFFEHAAFYGGTDLRILYGLDRFSEDLDFSLLKPSKAFRFDKYASFLQKELKAYGLDVRFEAKQKTANTAIESAFLKTNTYTQLILLEAPDSIISGIHKNAPLKVKLEIDTNPPASFDTEIKYIFSPVQFAVKTYTLPSLFAGKMHAILCRKWKNRVKGRDWYDFTWYIGHYPELNLLHLEKRMRQSGHFQDSNALSKDELIARLNHIIDNLNIEAARAEVQPFVHDSRSLDIWSKEFFKAAVQRIVFV
jgi:predicted nucleotidyltransferase component of viral defense system